MCDLVITILISSLTGVVASFFVWWLTFKYWVPNIKFSEKIGRAKTKDNQSKFKYHFKIENHGSRNIIDMEVIVRLRIKGLKSDVPNNWEIIYLPTSTLEYKKVAILRPFSKSNKYCVLEIMAYECVFFQKNIFPINIIEKSINKSLTLDDALKLGSESEFKVMIIGTDEYSGAKKFFESKNYKLNDIINKLNEDNSWEIIEGEINNE